MHNAPCSSARGIQQTQTPPFTLFPATRAAIAGTRASERLSRQVPAALKLEDSQVLRAMQGSGSRICRHKLRTLTPQCVYLAIGERLECAGDARTSRGHRMRGARRGPAIWPVCRSGRIAAFRWGCGIFRKRQGRGKRRMAGGPAHPPALNESRPTASSATPHECDRDERTVNLRANKRGWD